MSDFRIVESYDCQILGLPDFRIESLNTSPDGEIFNKKVRQSENSTISLFGLVNCFPADYRAQHFGSRIFRGHGSDVHVEHDEIGEHAGRQLAFMFFGELGEGGAGRVGGDGLFDVQFLLG